MREVLVVHNFQNQLKKTEPLTSGINNRSKRPRDASNARQVSELEDGAKRVREGFGYIDI